MNRLGLPPRTIDRKQQDAELLLGRIAEALGCSVESFGEDGPAERIAREASEMMRLWFKIESTEVRADLLRQARRAATGKVS